MARIQSAWLFAIVPVAALAGFAGSGGMKNFTKNKHDAITVHYNGTFSEYEAHHLFKKTEGLEWQLKGNTQFYVWFWNGIRNPCNPVTGSAGGTYNHNGVVIDYYTSVQQGGSWVATCVLKSALTAPGIPQGFGFGINFAPPAETVQVVPSSLNPQPSAGVGANANGSKDGGGVLTSPPSVNVCRGCFIGDEVDQ